VVGLNLSDTCISEAGGVALASALERNSTLVTLRLTGHVDECDFKHCIGRKGAVAFMHALVRNSSVACITLEEYEDEPPWKCVSAQQEDAGLSPFAHDKCAALRVVKQMAFANARAAAASHARACTNDAEHQAPWMQPGFQGGAHYACRSGRWRDLALSCCADARCWCAALRGRPAATASSLAREKTWLAQHDTRLRNGHTGPGIDAYLPRKT
jgi:hypothetical protein